jgi:hypothetical protein
MNEAIAHRNGTDLRRAAGAGETLKRDGPMAGRLG